MPTVNITLDQGLGTGWRLADGSAADPALACLADPDTGWYRTGSGAWGWSSNGAPVAGLSGSGVTVTGQVRVGAASGLHVLLEDTDQSDGATPFWALSSDGGALVVRSANRSGSTTTGTITRFTLTTGGALSVPAVYSTAVGGTNRAAYVDSTGLVGYLSSLSAHKTDVTPLASPTWLLDLVPVTYLRRLLDAEGQPTGATYPDRETGLLAESVEAVAPGLCFYDLVPDPADPDGPPLRVLRGVRYDALVVPLLALVQAQAATLTALEARLAAVEAGA